MPVYDDGSDGNYPLLGDLVPWPLLLITFSASMTVLVIEIWIGRQAGHDWWQAITQNLEKPVYTAFLCVIVGNTARLAKEGFMWLTREKARHEARVAARVAAEVREQVTAEVREQVTAEMRGQVAAEVREQVAAEVREEVTAEVTERVSAEVRGQVAAEVETRVAVEVMERVGARVAAEVAAQVGSERDKAWVKWLKSQNITPPQTPPQLSEN